MDRAHDESVSRFVEPTRRRDTIVSGDVGDRRSFGGPPAATDVLRWQATAGNAVASTVLAQRSSTHSLQRRPDAGTPLQPPAAAVPRLLDSNASPQPPAYVSVARLVDEIKKTLVGGSQDEKNRAVEWLNSYNIPDIAATMRLLRKEGILDELERYSSVRPLVEVCIKAVKSPPSITDDDVLRVHIAQRDQFRKEFNVTEDSFLPELEQICSELACRPEHLLAPMISESEGSAGGLRPGAVNPDSHAVGIIQFLPSTLASIGYKGGVAGFSAMNATGQLGWVRRFFLPATGKLTSPGRIHQFMFLPGSMDQAKSPADIVTRRNHPDKVFSDAYAANAKNLDPDGRGQITLGDLEAIDRRHVPAAVTLLAALRARPQPVTHRGYDVPL